MHKFGLLDIAVEDGVVLMTFNSTLIVIVCVNQGPLTKEESYRRRMPGTSELPMVRVVGA